MNKIKIKVTEKHILEGKPEEPKSCMIARAIEDQFRGEVKGAFVEDAKGISIHWNCGKKEYTAPSRIDKKINAFDEGRKVKPFEFYLTEKGI